MGMIMMEHPDLGGDQIIEVHEESKWVYEQSGWKEVSKTKQNEIEKQRLEEQANTEGG